MYKKGVDQRGHSLASRSSVDRVDVQIVPVKVLMVGH